MLGTMTKDTMYLPSTTSSLQLCSVMIMNKMVTLKNFICQVRRRMFDLLTYANNMPLKLISKPDVDTKEGFNTDNEALVVH